MKQTRILLTGASGYVGGRLLRELENQDYSLRCLAREPEFLAGRVQSQTEVVQGDVLEADSLDAAMEGVTCAFYLIHSMGQAQGFEEYDRLGSTNFARAAKANGVERIIYLGGLGDEHEDLSAHLRSRHEVGRILRESGVPTIELRASIVIGSGSLSFEMVRALTEKLPFMIMPQWVNVEAQPIGIGDLMAYLMESIQLPLTNSPVVEIGGSQCLSYRNLMEVYADARGLRRFMIPVPVLTPWLSSLWLGLVTPVYARVGRKLIDSIRHPTIVHDNSALSLFSIKPLSAREAIEAALKNEDSRMAETRWTDAVSSSGSASMRFGGVRVGSRLLDTRQVEVDATPAQAFEPIGQLGGGNGWYAYNWLWRLRGLLDLLVGGVGMRRGRPEGRPLRPGDALDFWRVQIVEAPRQLRLRAEMKLPGRAWLEFEVVPTEAGARIQQTAIFYPSGLAGLLYWYGIYPLHALVFRDMLQGVVDRISKPLPPGL